MAERLDVQRVAPEAVEAIRDLERSLASPSLDRRLV